jgi:hypothetical protein
MPPRNAMPMFAARMLKRRDAAKAPLKSGDVLICGAASAAPRDARAAERSAMRERATRAAPFHDILRADADAAHYFR